MGQHREEKRRQEFGLHGEGGSTLGRLKQRSRRRVLQSNGQFVVTIRVVRAMEKVIENTAWADTDSVDRQRGCHGIAVERVLIRLLLLLFVYVPDSNRFKS